MKKFRLALMALAVLSFTAFYSCNGTQKEEAETATEEVVEETTTVTEEAVEEEVVQDTTAVTDEAVEEAEEVVEEVQE